MEVNNKNYSPGSYPDLPPPPGTFGVIGWIKHNLFSSISNSILTILCIYLIYLLIDGAINWFILDAVFDANDKPSCRKLGDGACWAVITRRVGQFIYGFYPEPERWRVDITFIMLFFAAAPLLYPEVVFRKYLLLFSGIYPFLAFILIKGGFFSLKLIDTNVC